MDFTKHPLYPWLSEIRRDFHLHPEKSFQEKRTTARIKEILGALGVKQVMLPAAMEVGALGLVEGGATGKTLALRADIDALPITETNEAPYKSGNPGVMHACGHDAHAAIMLGVAKNLMESGLRERIKGRVGFIFQPAEETLSGARKMIEAGALKALKPDCVAACHVLPGLAVGKVGLYKDASFAAADTFHLTIHGKGAHGAKPEQSIDPIIAGVQFASGLQTIVSRNVDPIKSAVITVGRFQAGTAPNIIPEQAVLEGTIRSFQPEIRDLLIRRMNEMVAALEKGFGVKTEFQISEGVPALQNDETVKSLLRAAAEKVVGPKNITIIDPTTGAEDFALFAKLVPGALIRLGCSNEARGIVGKAHAPDFDLDEALMPIGVEIFTETIKAYLG
jgi:amidohydrolase